MIRRGSVPISALALASVRKLWQHECEGMWAADAFTVPMQGDFDVKLGAA
jgi:hypothetical protein